MNWTNCQRYVEKLRPVLGFTYPMLRKIAPKAATVSRQASFLMTNRCNAKCNFCMVAPYFDDPHQDLTLDKFTAIAKNLHLEKFGNVCLSGAGEPLLNPDTPAIIGFINHEYPRVKVFLTTNGIALDDRMINRLCRLNIDLVSCSLNAGSEAVYKDIMGVDRFAVVKENLVRYKAVTHGKRNATLMASFVAHRGNIKDVVQFVIQAYYLGLDGVTIRYAKFYRHNKLDPDNSLYFHQELSDTWMKKARAMAAQCGLHLVMADDPLFSEPFERRPCHFPHTDILIGLNGEAIPCCGGETIFKDKIALGEYDFGNALKQDIRCWHKNPLWQAARKMALPECDVCAIGVTWDGHLQKRHIMEWGSL